MEWGGEKCRTISKKNFFRFERALYCIISVLMFWRDARRTLLSHVHGGVCGETSSVECGMSACTCARCVGEKAAFLSFFSFFPFCSVQESRVDVRACVHACMPVPADVSMMEN